MGHDRNHRRAPSGSQRARACVVVESLLTQREAATLAGCSKDTIIRARRAGRFPHACLRGQAWMVPIDDLVAVGLYDPEKEVPTHGGAPSSGDGDVELVRALSRVAALEDIVARQDDELRFLRELTVNRIVRSEPR